MSVIIPVDFDTKVTPRSSDEVNDFLNVLCMLRCLGTKMKNPLCPNTLTYYGDPIFLRALCVKKYTGTKTDIHLLINKVNFDQPLQ